MQYLSERQLERLFQAEGALRRWGPRASGPELVTEALSVLNNGAPSILYNLSANGTGESLLGSITKLPLGRVTSTPFVRRDLVFSREYTYVTEGESVWGAENRAVLGEDLREDPLRWSIFRGTFLDPLAVGDFLRISLRSAEGRFVGMCGSFTPGTARFDPADRSLLEAFGGSIARVLGAVEALGLSFGAPHPIADMALTWASPAFAVTQRGELVFMNRAASLALPQPPGWLSDAIEDPAGLPADWSRSTADTAGGSALVFMQRRTQAEDWFVQAIIDEIGLPPYLREVAALVVKGCSYDEIARITGKSAGVVKTYASRVLAAAGTSSRTELVYEVLSRLGVGGSVWPVQMHAGAPHRG